MLLTQSIPRTIVAATLMFLMAGSIALAQRGDGRSGGRGGGDRGGSSRAFSGGGGDRSSRSFSGGRSSRSFSSGPSRSFSRDRGGESVRRSFSQPSGEQRRSVGDLRSRGFESSRSGRTFSPDGAQLRGYRGGERQSFGRDAFRTGPTSGRSLEGATRPRGSGDRAAQDGRRGGFDQSRREYQARRPSEGQVRDFLQMRARGERTAARDDFRRDFDGRSATRERFDSRDFERERDFRGRDFDRNRGQADYRDRDRDRDGRGGRDYDRWRGDVWLGERGEGRDHRDWSGRWRDGDRFRVSRDIRDNWRWDRHRGDFPFYGRWWRDRDWHGSRWGWWGDYAYRFNRPYYWWSWVAAPRLASWVNFGWPSYYYWDYGPGEYIYYDNGAIYVNGRWYQPGPVFYDRTVELVERAPDLAAEEASQLKWLPLGVFAVTREGVTEPDVLVQLAVTQDGVLAGTAFDPNTKQSYAVEGIVEKETQRAVWSYTDEQNRRIIQETSIFNLTQPEATGLVQYSPNDIRVIQLVRLEQPTVDAAATASEGELPAPAVTQ